MDSPFINRQKEIALLNREYRGSSLIVVYGRRRIGKTRLIQHWARGKKVAYSQAVEGSQILQIEQIHKDIGEHLPTNIVPTTWSDFLDLLALVKKKLVFVLDEFPYLVATDPSLPSLLQKWIDHKQPDNLKLILSGSSQTMMHGIFLDSSSPLFERAGRLIRVQPMSYKDFAKAVNLDPLSRETFVKYSLVGGVPKYWEFIDGKMTAMELADSMFFENCAFFENEPSRLLKDENIKGLTALSILEAIGRGSSKPSEIAQKLGVNQTSISRPLQVLMDSSLIKRELPFGESVRSTKKILYHIADYSLKFWFYVYSPHRSRWRLYSPEKKKILIEAHAASVLEDYYRGQFPDAMRYWEKGKLELDCVRYADEHSKKLLVSEIKWKELGKVDKVRLKEELQRKYFSSKLSGKHVEAEFEVLGLPDVLASIVKKNVESQ